MQPCACAEVFSHEVWAAGASVSTQNLLKPSLKAASKLSKWRLVPRWYKSGDSRVKGLQQS